ncbi:MAG: GntR family transcriptional regulator [Granulosicoccus sp.]|nr:GntR family transcriptional regulator [Granulosicoccus sp.]
MTSPGLDLSNVRRTTADELFDQLRTDIEKLRLLPGTKLSEAEVARQYNVSRQPVREALIRLDNLELVEIQPQKATIVRRISRSGIEQARFVRSSVELEIARRACARYGGELDQEFEDNLNSQVESLDSENYSDFNRIDWAFHALLCRAADCKFAIDIIVQCKAKVDRLCLFSLSDVAGAQQVYDDHLRIYTYLQNRDITGMSNAIIQHLARLDDTIERIQKEHEDYFDD